MATVDEKINRTIGIEGNYSNNKDDSGGETRWGISIATARRNGYTGPMQDLPRGIAKAIYKKEYFIDPGFDKIALINDSIAEELFDTGVNIGPHLPSTWFQENLNLLNNREKYYPDLRVDGILGKVTRDAFQAYLALRGKDGILVMLRMLNTDQGAHYKRLGMARAKDEEFIFGWFLNRVMI